MTIREALNIARQELTGIIDDPARTAASIVAAATGRGREFLYAHPEYELSSEEEARMGEFLRRRRLREPLQYILRQQEFYGLSFEVGPGVLIPRPETEILVGQTIAAMREKESPRLLELGIGSGCISVSILCNLPTARISAADISAVALDYARRNAERHGVSERLYLFESDLFDSVPREAFDAVLANPPYVAAGDLPALQPEVRDFEPPEALTDGADGLRIIRRIIAQAPDFLRSGGLLLMEIGAGQSGPVAEMFSGDDRWAGFSFLRDLQGIERTLVAQLK